MSWNYSIWFDLLFLAILLRAAVIDYKQHMIPNYIHLAILFVGIARCIFLRQIIDNLLGGGLLFLLFLVIALRTPLGGGDVKLVGAIGFAYGYWQSLWLILFACIFFLIGNCKKLKEQSPFAPAIFMAAVFITILKYIYQINV